jgi:zinc transport system substrate-binding protein
MSVRFAPETIGAADMEQTPVTTRRRGFRLGVLVVALVGPFLVINAMWPRHPVAADKARLHVLCTFLPVQIFAANVIGDAPDVRLNSINTSSQSCPHTYSLTGDDLKKISRADVIVANGLGVEPFLDQIRKVRPQARLITLSDHCSLLPLKPGEEDQHAHAGHDHQDGHGHETEMNPHTWMSPRQAAIQVRTLAKKLAETDPVGASKYLANGEDYARRLDTLAAEMDRVGRGLTKRDIVTAHPAFDYLARDLKLNVVATLHGVPGETESAAEMARVIGKIRSTRVAAIFTEFGSADQGAQTIGRNAGVPVYSLSVVTDAEANVPAHTVLKDVYILKMEQNLNVLKQVLAATTNPG